MSLVMKWSSLGKKLQTASLMFSTIFSITYLDLRVYQPPEYERVVLQKMSVLVYVLSLVMKKGRIPPGFVVCSNLDLVQQVNERIIDKVDRTRGDDALTFGSPSHNTFVFEVKENVVRQIQSLKSTVLDLCSGFISLCLLHSELLALTKWDRNLCNVQHMNYHERKEGGRVGAALIMAWAIFHKWHQRMELGWWEPKIRINIYCNLKQRTATVMKDLTCKSSMSGQLHLSTFNGTPLTSMEFQLA